MFKEALNISGVALAFRRVCGQSTPPNAVLHTQSGNAAPDNPAAHAGTERHTADATGSPDARALTARVEMALTADAELSRAQIRVEASGGTVVLQGFVDSPADMLRALDLVGDIAGVETIANRLHLVWW